VTKISRRTFIKASATAIGAAALAACSDVPLSPTPTATVRPVQPSPTPAATATVKPTDTPKPYDWVKPTPADMAAAERWIASVTETGELPVSMLYDDQPSAELLKNWELEKTSRALDDRRIEHVLTRKDPRTGLAVRWQAIAYADYPAVEWVLYLKNESAADTPILDTILPLDALFPSSQEQVCTLHHAKGSQFSLDDFTPLEDPVPQEGALSVASVEGRSSDGALPFFNLDLGGTGVVVAIGWTGNWRIELRRPEGGVQVTAGMQRTHLKLHPGEEIRTPRILLLFWNEDRLRGNNLLRRFILAHKAPQRNGKPAQMPIPDGAWGERTTESHLAKIRWLQENQIPVDTYWIDAGWYGNSPFNPKADTWGQEWVTQVGNWYPNETTYPQGLKPIGDACKAAGLGFILWFEPERVWHTSELAATHPEFMSDANMPATLRTENYLFNLGDPAARLWMTDRLSSLIQEGGVTIYRHDFNMAPNLIWMVVDPPDRKGMSEIRHIEGLYAFWDDLVARNPGLLIDNCASGGRRIDLETIARSIVLHPSDAYSWPDAAALSTFMQNLTHGLGLWYPMFLARTPDADPYHMRSGYGTGMGVSWASPALEGNQPPPLDQVRKYTAEELEVRPYFYGDFYPLAARSGTKDVWAAWQCDRPDLMAGIVQVFRREDSPTESGSFKLMGLDPAGQYEMTDADTGEITRATGRELMEQGLSVRITAQPGAVLFRYRKVG